MLHYQVQFFSHWHVGSGLSGGAYADLLVIKDAEGFPYIPGRTLKGLLRDAAEEINYWQPGLVSSSFINTVFGENPEKAIGELPNEGLAFFSDAVLPSTLKAKISNLSNERVSIQDSSHPSKKSYGNYFFDVRSSTKINEKGTAVDHTLRQMEVTVPLKLYAYIGGLEKEAGFSESLSYCMQYIKRLGMGRNRGLGRCKIEQL